MKHSVVGAAALGVLQGWEPGALALVAPWEWMPQPCPPQWASEVAQSTW